MEWIYLGFVIFLFVLAISDLWVGVSNDAVNFLNSAIGSRTAKFRTIIIVAAIGVFCGCVMSNGMMDIARHGMFQPEYFSFQELMYIFLAVMVTDIILLDVFNSLGLPTSTTVSMVFELLGATFALSTLKILGAEGSALGFGDLMNTSKALTVIVAIFVSVALAFFFGVVLQYLSRLLFTFHFKKNLGWKIGIFGGIAVTSIVYFLIIKGAKDLAFMTPEVKGWINDNTMMLLGACLVVFTILMQILHFCKVNVFKVVVLIGTFSLATAFAGNDLVNFIGVPLAGLESFNDWRAAGAGDPSAHMMDVLNGPAKTPFIFLLCSGVVMVSALAMSKKAHNVTKTEINLAKQDEGEEMFGSSKVARSIVRWSSRASATVVGITPKPVKAWIENRFDKTVIDIEDGAAYDLVRASVNLVVASLLIALGTSFKLPLSTTYVTFMVAMGSSLADRAWSRESAVFRVTGVLSVIGGWFLTAGAAFISAFIIAMLMKLGGLVVAAIIVTAGLVALVHNNLKYKAKDEDGINDKAFREAMTTPSEEAWPVVSRYIADNEAYFLNSVARRYENITDGLLNENVKVLRSAMTEISQCKQRMKTMRKKETYALKHLPPVLAMEKGAWFYTRLNNMEQLHYTLKRICEPVLEHVDNNFTPIPEDYAQAFIIRRDKAVDIIKGVARHCQNRDFETLRQYDDEIAGLKIEFSDLRKALTDDIHNKNMNLTMAYLYLNLLQESEHLVIEMEQLSRDSRKFQE